MRNATNALITLCGCTAILFGVIGCANSGSKAKPAAAQPTEAEMMAKMATLGIPNSNHAFLTASAGTWDGKITSWNPFDPSMPPSVSKGTTVITAMMGGLYTRGETKGAFEMGPGQTFEFEGFGLNTYNSASKKFECTWADNMAPMVLTFVGDLSADGKTLTMTSNYHCPMKDAPTWMRLVEKHHSPTSMTLEMYGPTMDGKGEMMAMKIDYTKKK